MRKLLFRIKISNECVISWRFSLKVERSILFPLPKIQRSLLRNRFG